MRTTLLAMTRAAALLAASILAFALPGAAHAAGGAPVPLDTWPATRMQEPASLQNGAKIFANYCLGCHGAAHMRWNRLTEIGLDEKQIKEFLIFGEQRVGDLMTTAMAPRAALNFFGKVPPDLSVIAKARDGGPDYLYALLTGYRYTPPGFELAPGMYYNTAFPGHQIAMPPPLIDGAVAYTDGTPRTVDNYARDVSAYLMWAAEPKLEERHKVGAHVMIFLIVFLVIMYLAKRAVWAGLHRRDASRAA